MNEVCGKVLLKETNVGIPDLVVEIFHVNLSKQPDQVVGKASKTKVSTTSRSLPSIAEERRLVSGATKDDGSFKLEYEDADFQRFNPGQLRPNVRVRIRAGESVDLSGATNILYTSSDILEDASPREVCIIRIPTATLLAAGIPAPTNVMLDAEEPAAIIEKIKVGVSRQIKIQQEVQKIAAEQVEAERQSTEQIEKQVESRLLEKLTGVSDKLTERLNYVRPGVSVDTAMFHTWNKSIKEKINKRPPAKGYIVVSEADAEKFKKPDGTFRDDIPAAEIRPFLFGTAEENSQSTVLIREMPTDRARPSQLPTMLTERDVKNTESTDRANGGQLSNELNIMALNGATPDGNNAQTTASPTIPDFISLLLGTMTSPEEGIAFGADARTNADKIGTELKTLTVHSGPADVPAFHDFHNLQIASDYIWQKVIDETILERVNVLSRQLQLMGGNPVVAMNKDNDPIKALRNELRIVQGAHNTSNLNRMVDAMNMGALRTQQLYQNSQSSASDQGSGFIRKAVSGNLINSSGTHPSTDPNSVPVLTQGEPRFPHELLKEIDDLLNERYAFEIFVPGSVNFGVLVTYRQQWVPLDYQVGDLAKTITLAPKEMRKISTKRVVKKERRVTEMENSLRVRKEEASNTGRDEAEIVSKAEAKTNFSLTAQGTYDIAIAEGTSTMVFGKDATTNSSDTKKAFREAVIKAAQEYKDERKLEVETKESFEEEITETAEITNPNDELTVTYLFYELQRRYKISEQIHSLTPVVLVAMDVPNPSRQSIDSLLLSYGWIIDRVLLDDQFRRPLEYFRTKIVGEEIALTTMVLNLVQMRAIVEELKKSYNQARDRSNALAEALLAQKQAEAQKSDSGDSGVSASDLLEWVVSPIVAAHHLAGEAAVGSLLGSDTQGAQGAQILEDVARERYQRAVELERDLRAQLESETSALRAANDAYAKAQAEWANNLMDIGTLRLHIKENILYYMQAIWSHTFKDQIFLSLQNIKVPKLSTSAESYALRVPSQTPTFVPAKAGQVALEVEANVQFEDTMDPDEDFVTLSEIADIDNVLGYKANYMILPLRISNRLTDYMMTPFANSELGLHDPDELGNFTPDEFVTYARALYDEMKQQLQQGQITEEGLKAAVSKLGEQYRRLLSSPRNIEDEITVPTGSLYIEALPGAHPILEDFKLIHRAVDVKKVQAEVRKLEMENIRYAARILAGEREDPDVDRKVVISGNGQAIVVPPVEN